MVKCDECMMYDPYDGYCSYFQEFIDDEGYDCTIKRQEEDDME